MQRRGQDVVTELLSFAYVQGLESVGVSVVPVVDVEKPRSENPPLPWLVKPHRDAYGSGCRIVDTWEEAEKLISQRDFVQVFRRASQHRTTRLKM